MENKEKNSLTEKEIDTAEDKTSVKDEPHEETAKNPDTVEESVSDSDTKSESEKDSKEDPEEVVEFADSTKIKDKTDDDGVTFATSSKSKKSSSAKKISAKDDPDNITFAIAGRHRINSGSEGSDKKKIPTALIAIAAALVVCAVTGGVILAISSSRNSVQTGADTESTNTVESSHLSVPSTPSDTDVAALPVIREESAEIKTINTESIVFGDGVTVAGVNLKGKTLSEAYDAMQDTLLTLRDNINISITCDGSKNITLTQDNFKFDTDISNVLIQAYHYSRGELEAPTVQTTKIGDSTDFTVTSVVNKDSVRTAVKTVAEKFDIQPVDAHVDKFRPDQAEKFTYVDGSDGYLVDQNEITNQITDILAQATKTGSFTVETKKTPYKITLADIKANTKLIASSCTTANNVWASVHNMELAIETASGTVVQPGETFSFNEMTGDTTTGELGYVPSTAIVRGQYEQQYGGGICQASTTLYLCALKADMEVVERHAHQFPSIYADRGLDATVDYGNLDMRFKNTKDYPIYIATYVYDYNGDGMDELMVEMYGQIPTEYDEIVPVGWVTYAGSETYSAMGAKVYFKDGKEIKREYLPSGSYDYHYDDYYTALSLIPNDPENGPASVSPTYSTPTIYSPNGCGSSAPVAYGTASEYLAKIKKQNSSTSNNTNNNTSSSKPSSTSSNSSN